MIVGIVAVTNKNSIAHEEKQSSENDLVLLQSQRIVTLVSDKQDRPDIISVTRARLTNTLTI
jgi:hypothetical protein